MSKKLITILSIFLFFSLNQALSQEKDTATVMFYNLTKYGGSETYCTLLPAGTRNNYISTIIGFVKPDIFGVCEMADNAQNVNNLLNGALNVNGRNFYQAASYFSEPNDAITNMLFYNKDKFVMKSQTVIACLPRQATVYNLKYKKPSSVDDTASFLFVIIHLKASNGSPEATQRATCATNIMAYLQSNYNVPKKNIFVMGDFNIYTTNEAAYQGFTTNANAKINLVDPIYSTVEKNTLTGNYFYKDRNITVPTGTYNTAAFAPYHTQCPTATQANCLVGGGMDDRFDYILFNKSVYNDSAHVNFLPGTYIPLGNDGLHYNKALNDGPNNSGVSSGVLDALIRNSDHIPVVAKFHVSVTTVTGIDPVITSTGEAMKIIGAYFKTNTSIKILGNETTVSGKYIRDTTSNVITIVGFQYFSTAPGSTFLATIMGAYTEDNGFNITINPNLKYQLIDEASLKDSLIIGSYLKTASSLIINGAQTSISGKYFEDTATNSITITGLQTFTLGGGLTYFVTIVGTYSVDAAFNMTVNPNMLYVMVRQDLTSTNNGQISQENAIKYRFENGLIYFEINNKMLWYSLIDIQGRELLISQLSGENNAIDTKFLPVGLYILKVFDEKGFYKSFKFSLGFGGF